MAVEAAAAAAAAATILAAVGEEGSSPLLLWLSNLCSGVVSETLAGRRLLIVRGGVALLHLAGSEVCGHPYQQSPNI